MNINQLETLGALDQNERGMWPALWPNDLVLLDRSPIERRRPKFEHVYALCWEGKGWVGRCRVVGGALVVVVDFTPSAGGTTPCTAAVPYS